MKPYVFGADIGGTAIKLGLFSQEGTLIEKWEIPTRTENGGEAVLPDVAASVREAMARHGIVSEQVEGIGIAVPGPVDAETVVYKCVNLGWGVFSIRARMNELLPEIPNVAAGNDANVAALGELWQGGGRGYKSAVMITLGTGVGGGVVLDGKIVSGRNGGAGEIGHMTVEPDERQMCSCGKRGCLEQYASARGAADMARRMLAQCDTPSALRSMADFTARELCEQAKQGDIMAQAILERFGNYLGRAMGLISCTVDPDVYIIGGGMSQAGETVLDPVLRAYRKYAFHVSAQTKAVIACLGNDAGIYGCAKMVLS